MKKIYLITLIVILLISNLFVYFWVCKKNNSEIDPNLKDYIEKIEAPEDFTENDILVPGFENINVEYNNKDQGLELLNPKENNVYFQYEVILEENNEILSQTQLIPPGKSVEVFPWDELSPKTYNVIIKIRTYSIEDSKKELNGANLKIKMNIFKNNL